MTFFYVIVAEISRIGDFYIPPRQYGILNVTSPHSPFLAFGRFDSSSESEPSIIPAYVNENEDKRIGDLRISLSDLNLQNNDQFSFPIDENNQITLRIVKTWRMSGKIRSATPIPLPERALIGHRGFGANGFTSAYLENSIPSYQAALRVGANAVEIDVQLSKESTVVVNHNLDVETKADDCLSGVRVNRLTVKLFKKSGLCTPFEIERPTFREVCEALPKSAIFDIHLKFAPDDNIPYLDRNFYIERVIQEIEEYGKGRQVFFCTFDVMLAVSVALRQRKYPILLLAGISPDDPISLLVNHIRAGTPLLKWAGVAGFVFLSTNLMAAPKLAEECLSLGFTVMSWGTENLSEEGVIAQMNMGVTGFVTDDVELTRELIRKNTSS
jgi:glycerophosphoryl diester phosphodiesterase